MLQCTVVSFTTVIYYNSLIIFSLICQENLALQVSHASFPKTIKTLIFQLFIS